MPTRTKSELGRDLVRALRALRAGRDDDPNRTRRLREVAQFSVDLREHFLTAEGNPDWAARTWPYREFLRERYKEAGFEVEEARTVQAAVRWHVSKYVRERLTPEQLEDYGLRAESSVTRGRESRGARAALLQAAQTPETTVGDGDPDVLRAMAGALLVLQRVSPAGVADLDERAAGQARVVLGRIKARADELGAAATRE